ncbi:YsnF/AvaK domain-containing protein [Clostridium sp. CX1]|uniref:YsnF/AvaK domain-containing protein n=1 Tax=Clostridium sp. CX1 TaxID=2978346 RepID=UPI0021BFD711|nr:YsnF/AvaK domain-containing protein [Clostridium sp. CX1]MCT8975926.1 YsnF/AvaK domain-containing protein [Clostridium sp. CX1]
MGIFDGMFGNNDDTKKESNEDNAKLRLRKEELDITKNRVQKGEVELSKEIVEEQKSVDVPVTREEVVIERTNLNNEVSDSPITNEETIRIPVSEEKVDVNKRTVVTGEVSAHKHVIEDTEHIDETLKREEARVNTTGDANVVDNGTDNKTDMQ